MAKIINGKEISAAIREELKLKTAEFVKAHGVRPGLAVIIVGNDPASKVYVRNKRLACEEIGFYSQVWELPAETTQQQLNAFIAKLNVDPAIHGILCQLPLPPHLDENEVIRRIDPKKDVDAFHPVNVGRMSIGLPAFISATPLGILTLLRRYNVETRGKKVAILGRSNIVGKPMASLMMQKQWGDSTVTVLHSHSANLAEECSQADILIAAIGSPAFVTADMVKPGAVVIDVGTTRVPDASRPSGFRLQGDVDFQAVSPLCSAITPVPGGVGPMTICMLMLNTLQAYKQRA